MAFNYSYDAENQLIVLTGTGAVTTGDRNVCVKRMIEDRILPDEAAILIDVCRVPNPPSKEEIEDIGKLLKQLHKRFRSPIAILNTTVGHATMSHLIAAITSVYCPVRAFITEAQARNWLKKNM
jgi:hypothetical protein